MHCMDNFCHDLLPVRQLRETGGIHVCPVLSCNLGLKHNQNNRPIKLRKKILTPAVLPRLDRCECGTEAIQHCPTVKSTLHTQS
eukprot:6532782-Prorocentrum_lima.AAC.1